MWVYTDIYRHAFVQRCVPLCDDETAANRKADVEADVPHHSVAEWGKMNGARCLTTTF